MPSYRLYWINRLGHIERMGEFESDTDSDAIAAVERSREDVAMELWRGAEKVGQWRAHDSVPPVST